MAGKTKYKKWTKDSVEAEARKYKTRSEFMAQSASAYVTAKRLGIFDEVTSHMFKARFVWTEEMVKSAARKYKTRGEFFENDRSAYSAAVRMGILEEVTTHMPRYAGKGKKRGPNKRTLEKQPDGGGTSLGSGNGPNKTEGVQK